MITSQRLMIIVIIMNMMLGWAAAIYVTPTVYNRGDFIDSINFLKDWDDKTNTEEIKYSGAKRPDTQEEPTVMNTFTWGLTMLGVFINGINPLSINRLQFDTTLERIAADLLVLIRLLFTSLMIFEAYLIFKNKKAS